MYINVAVYALCYQMQSPLQPQLVESVGLEKIGYAGLRTWFSAVQVLGSLISGMLIDSFGSRAALLLTFAASAVCYLALGMATQPWHLYAAFIPSVFQHGMLAAKAWVAYDAQQKGTTQHLATLAGYCGLAYGLGYVIGPTLGAHLAEVWSIQAVANLCAMGSIASAVSIVLVLPAGAASPAASASTRQGSTLAEKAQAMFRLLLLPGSARSLSVSKAVFGLGLGLFYSFFSLYSREVFNLSTTQYGYMLSASGMVGMAMQTFGVHACRTLGSPSQLVLAASVVLAGCMLGLVGAGSMVHLVMLLLPVVVCSTLWNSHMTAAFVRAAPAGASGSAVALEMALGSGVRMFTPMATTLLMTRAGQPGLAVASSALIAASVPLLLQVSAHVWESHGEPAAGSKRKSD